MKIIVNCSHLTTADRNMPNKLVLFMAIKATILTQTQTAVTTTAVN